MPLFANCCGSLVIVVRYGSVCYAAAGVAVRKVPGRMTVLHDIRVPAQRRGLVAMPFRTSRDVRQLVHLIVLAIIVAASPALAQMDTFSSGGSRGNTTNRTGSQSFQPNDGPCSNPFGCGRGGPGYQGTGRDVYCQDSPGMPQRGPYSHTGTNTPCGLRGSQYQPPPTAPVMVQPVFNYYYVNGINTPDQPPAGTQGPARGNYQWDWQLIRGNLLDLGPYKGLGRRPGGLTSIRVTDEIDRMDTQTQNFSGKDPASNQLVDRLCASAQVMNAIAQSNGRTDNSPLGMAVAACGIYDQMVATLNNVRSNGSGMAIGDLFECFRQALGANLAGVAASFGLPPVPTGIDAFSSQQPEVANIARLILKKYRSEGARTGTTPAQNYFIVIGHSQGNFFVEAVAYRLLHYEGADGAYIFHNRLGLLSFASPTDYASVTSEPGFSNRVEHIKRQDDMINVLLALPAGVGKRPWTTGDSRALWPFPQLDWSNWRTASDAVAALGQAPPAGCTPAGTPQCDGALYVPYLNSHLLENYIADANFTMPGQPIRPDVASQLGQGASGLSPKTAPPLLNTSRAALVRLKRALLSGSTTSYAPQAGGFPMPQGADLGRAASSILLKLLGQ
jgi:hypothetical protein